MRITILMPCLNESLTIGRCIEKAKKWGQSSGLDFEILIADNGSNDGSQKIAIDLGARVVDVSERGYGAALGAGCNAANGDLIIMGDSDDSYDFSSLDAYVKAANNGYELIMGNRFLGGIAPGAMPWKNKYIGNPVLSLVGKILFKSHINDFHCGLRAITKTGYQKLGLVTTGMEFASEMVIKAHLSGLSICEVPTTLSKDGRDRPPHLRPWRDGWRHLKFMMLMSPKWLFIRPAILMFMVSLGGLVNTYPSEYVVLGRGFDAGAFSVFCMLLIASCITSFFGLVVHLLGERDGIFEKKWMTKLNNLNVLELGSLTGLLIMILSVVVVSNPLFGWLAKVPNSMQTTQNIKELILGGTLGIVGLIILFFSFVIGYIASPVSVNAQNKKI